MRPVARASRQGLPPCRLRSARTSASDIASRCEAGIERSITTDFGTGRVSAADAGSMGFEPPIAAIRTNAYEPFIGASRSLGRQDFQRDGGQAAAPGVATPPSPVPRIPATAHDREYQDHHGPEQSELVAPFRKRPHIADLEMPAPEHRQQQVHGTESRNGTREESQRESHGADDLDRTGERNLCG